MVPSSDFIIGEALADDLRNCEAEAASVIKVFAVVVTEHLLIKVAEKMDWLDTHVGSMKATLQQTSEVFHSVGVNRTIDIGDRMALRQRLAEIEDERPEALGGWVCVFEGAGLAEVRSFDRSDVMAAWTRDVRRAMGLSRYFHTVKTVSRRWGLSGLRAVLESERIFASRYLGYAVVVGLKE